MKTVEVFVLYLPHNARDREGKPVFIITKEQFIQQLTTKALYFPYLKKQVNVSTSG